MEEKKSLKNEEIYNEINDVFMSFVNSIYNNNDTSLNSEQRSNNAIELTRLYLNEKNRKFKFNSKAEKLVLRRKIAEGLLRAGYRVDISDKEKLSSLRIFIRNSYSKYNFQDFEIREIINTINRLQLKKIPYLTRDPYREILLSEMSFKMFNKSIKSNEKEKINANLKKHYSDQKVTEEEVEKIISYMIKLEKQEEERNKELKITSKFARDNYLHEIAQVLYNKGLREIDYKREDTSTDFVLIKAIKKTHYPEENLSDRECNRIILLMRELENK
jgi:hypothetical protein